MAANPPTSEGACVLIALNTDCEGAKLVLRYFFVQNNLKKRNLMNRIHQKEC